MDKDKMVSEILMAAISTGEFGKHNVEFDAATNQLIITLKG